MIKIEDYREVAPRGAVDLILRLAHRVQGRRFVHVSSTRYGVATAELPGAIVPIMNDLGIDTAWEVISGDAAFFATTKALTAALEGEDRVLTESMLQDYLEMNRRSARTLALEGDLIVIHDPAPASLVEGRGATGRWVWRCHLDLSAPQRRTWGFFGRFLSRYDAAVFSHPLFAPRLSVPQFIVHPSIDPLSPRNRDLSRQEIRTLREGLGVGDDKRFLLQVGELDRRNDPVGAIAVYRLVKRHHDVRLVLAGVGAADGPDGAMVLDEVRTAAAHDGDIIVLELPPEAHAQINALQRAAAVVLHRATRDRFGLEAAEAMWKGTPVIGRGGGGLAVQIIPEVTGYTVDSVEGAAFRVRQLLTNPELLARMGGAGREHVRRSFLLTRHLADYLALMIHLTGRRP